MKWQTVSILHPDLTRADAMGRYVAQSADVATCLSVVRVREKVRGRRFEWLIRVRPDVVAIGWARLLSRKGISHGLRGVFGGMNDRFYGGSRNSMARIMSCHDVFRWVVKTGRGGRQINAERFLKLCAVRKRVKVFGIDGVDVRRVGFKNGSIPVFRDGVERLGN